MKRDKTTTTTGIRNLNDFHSVQNVLSKAIEIPVRTARRRISRIQE